MRLATLNAQNLRLQNADGRPTLHGAWDGDQIVDTDLDPIDRRLTAELLAELDADVIALQEVFDRQALDYFCETFLQPLGAAPYPFRVCLPGNDGRGANVALLSRLSLSNITSHASLRLADVGIDPPEGVDPDLPIFRRDCLTAQVGDLAVYVCHFKSPWPDAEKAWMTRRLEALATRRLIERHFPRPPDGLWLIIGDLNEPSATESAEERAIAPLETDFAADLMLRTPMEERWTYYDRQSGFYHCPDALLASPKLADQYPNATPRIVRKGLGFEASRFQGDRFTDVGKHRPHASDHAAVIINFPGL